MSDTPHPWRRLHGHTAFANRWIQVDVDTLALPDGRVYDYTVIRRQQHGAAVLAFNDQGQVLLEREYRYPVDEVIWQMPGGLIDPGETPLQAAQRELAEETGHVAPTWRHLGTFWDNPAFEDMLVHIFVAEQTRPDGRPRRDAAEFIQHAWVDLAWIRAQVRCGEIKERVIIAALGFLSAQ
ncbi:MAG: NUDIX hydrolase [Caldilineales bacterium]|nr:NUDIX hydrolase [Caldilineales bacterium]